jgi:uncharacterized membrane protein
MRTHAVTYIATLLVLCLLDSVWLTTMLPFYQHALGGLLAPAPDFLAAGAFYLLYAVGVVVLVIRPSHSASWRAAAARGALFGLVAYGTYDLTNQATLRAWPSMLTLIDMGWGTLLTACAASIGRAVARRVR